MYDEPLFLKPVLQERIWGGTALRDEFGYEIPSETTGECWGISAHPNGPSSIINGPLQGMTLDEVFNNYRDLFNGDTSDAFPLLTKILDAKRDLSVQVHPNDDYAREKEQQPYGKTECWYILNSEPDAEIVFGHHAQSSAEFREKVDAGEWDQLLRRVKVKPGDFFYVPSGTIHAIGAGIQILETQQSSDITYRVYDYDRRGGDGELRELHIEPSIEVTSYPHKDPLNHYVARQDTTYVKTRLAKETYFSVYHWDVRGQLTHEREEPYLLASVISGEGNIRTKDQENPLKKGDHFIVPATIDQLTIEGDCELVVSHPEGV
ncbi:mannose-6-phosphate isomerase, class I [Tuberibacillus sp. Marseille-P3662]|uniref:mannose-6-phosphate isomerase, class I n=1 Tax=Tuberibacillus sp. Marseille-P3662 TaxID=1965358 RepID=UPI000A1C9CFD|nr:mannose-6-phosphate isomerase, class I [Tuberibacillus sp. Marseille-P3662]